MKLEVQLHGHHSHHMKVAYLRIKPKKEKKSEMREGTRKRQRHREKDPNDIIGAPESSHLKAQ